MHADELNAEAGTQKMRTSIKVHPDRSAKAAADDYFPDCESRLETGALLASTV